LFAVSLVLQFAGHPESEKHGGHDDETGEDQERDRPEDVDSHNKTPQRARRPHNDGANGCPVIATRIYDMPSAAEIGGARPGLPGLPLLIAAMNEFRFRPGPTGQ
jgi:hypothetical protein